MPIAVARSLQNITCLCCALSCCAADYGVVCCWGLTAKQEQDILTSLAKKAQQQPLPSREVRLSTRTLPSGVFWPAAAALGLVVAHNGAEHQHSVIKPQQGGSIWVHMSGLV
jgi:hypothetical protein